MKEEPDVPETGTGKEITEDEKETAEDRIPLRAPVIYEVVRQQGIEEMERPNSSLLWSGVAAGLAISASVTSKGALEYLLGDMPGGKVISNFGYTVGFLLVIVGRFQLFTENTITVILPLLAKFTPKTLASAVRVWSVVLVANLIGTAIVAALSIYVGLLPPGVLEGSLKVSRHLAEYSAWQNLIYGAPSGFLIAGLVWANANTEGSGFWMIVVVTYVIALCGFTHVVAGSTEYFMLMMNGEMSLLNGFGVGILPTLVGNIIGGTGLFAFIAYAQVREEI